MLRHEYLACLELHKRLKENILGDVFVSIDENDSLIIHISAYRHMKYKYEYKHISFEMFGGELNYDKVVRIILHDYNEFIMRKFFRR